MHAKVPDLDKLADPHLMLFLNNTGDDVYIIPVRKNNDEWAVSGTYDISKPICKLSELDDFLDFLAAQGNKIVSRDIKAKSDLALPLIVPARSGTLADAFEAAAWLIIYLDKVGE